MAFLIFAGIVTCPFVESLLIYCIGSPLSLYSKDTTLGKLMNESGNVLPEGMKVGRTVVTTNKKELTTCEEPLKCISPCDGINLGQMDCPAGKTCCWIS